MTRDMARRRQVTVLARQFNRRVDAERRIVPWSPELERAAINVRQTIFSLGDSSASDFTPTTPQAMRADIDAFEARWRARTGV